MDDILNFLQNTIEDPCKSSLMNLDGNLHDSIVNDDTINATLDSNQGLLDNLIKTVCDGFDESTLIDKDDSLDKSVIICKDKSHKADVDVIKKSCQTEDAIEKGSKEGKATKISLTSTGAGKGDETARLIKRSNKKEKTKKDDPSSSSESAAESKTKGSLSQEEGDVEVLSITKEGKQDDGKDMGEVKIIPPVTDDESQSKLKFKKLDRSRTSFASNKETTDHAFQINDNMKKGLSKLAFPLKSAFLRTARRKKKIPPLRPISNTRITIGEALEKAQDVQKSLCEENKSTGVAPKVDESNSGVKDQHLVNGKMLMKIGSFEAGDSLHALVSFGEVLEHVGDNSLLESTRLGPYGVSPGASEKEVLIKEQQTESKKIATDTPPVDTSLVDQNEDLKIIQESVKVSENAQETPKVRSKPATRCKVTSRMWNLLRFTFDHEHFPSSVHMARLAKMMGITWSQVRNWFTNRRVENKKACVFPRDKALSYCSYCNMDLTSEAEQKSHLFASTHVKKILGSEYVGGSDVEGIKWKQVPQGEKAVSKSSGNILPVGSTHNSNDKQSEEEENVDSVTKRLGKRWKDSFLSTNATEATTGEKATEPTTAYSVGTTGEIDGKKKIPVSDIDAELKIKEEVKVDLNHSSALTQAMDSVHIKKEGEENNENSIKVEGIDSEQLSHTNTVVQSDTPASGVISNKYLHSSQEGKYDYSQALRKSHIRNKSYTKDLELPKSWTRYPPTESSYKGLRRTQQQAKRYTEDCTLGYQCPKCFRIFQTEWQMIKHSMTHLLFICDICQMVFPSEHFLKLHLHDHLTVTYEEEKYYCQFSCRVCHSLKCECYEPLYVKPKDIPKNYERPQKAIRSKKTFITKPYSGPNDHLRVNIGNYQKHLQNCNGDQRKFLAMSTKLAINRSSMHVNEPKVIPLEYAAGTSVRKVQIQKQLPNVKIEEVPQPSSLLSIRKDLLLEKSREDSVVLSKTEASENSEVTHDASNSEIASISHQIISPPPASIVEKEKEPLRRVRGRPVGRKTTSKACVYNDGDFYYMCEVCDSSFLSKAELQEHMFFHRLKSRSRRGEKRSHSETSKETFKKPRVKGTTSQEAEAIDVVGFERFKCPQCKSHFANVTDFNRHKTQAHSEELPAECLEVLKCNYCIKTYRRERELRRHLKHACSNAPRHLKDVLSVGITLQALEDKGDGPHFSVVNKSLDILLKEGCSLPVDSPPINADTNGPYKCRYCPLITRRAREMKRHIWKYCNQTPKIIKKRCKDGATLEELGFNCQEDEVEDMLLSGIDISGEMLDEEDPTVSPDGKCSTSFVSETPSAERSPGAGSNKSKEPLVCSYCGIWYYREISLVKHMKERCIIIPTRDKELLNLGANLCETLSNSVSTKVLNNAKGIYKKVKNTDLKENLTRMTNLQPCSPTDEISTIDITVKSSSKETKILNKMESSKKSNSKEEEESTDPRKSDCGDMAEEIVVNNRGGRQSKKNSNKKSTRCNRCHETFLSAEAVLAHSSVHHGPKKGYYKCKLCYERFQRYKQLREHVWEHTQETPYKCHVCDAKFRLSDSIMGHLLSIHNYTSVHEKNLYKWLPMRNGKYRILETASESNRFDYEETLEGVDTTLDIQAEDMVVTDDIWTKKNDTGVPTIGNAHNTSKPQRCIDEETTEMKEHDIDQHPNKIPSMPNDDNDKEIIGKSWTEKLDNNQSKEDAFDTKINIRKTRVASTRKASLSFKTNQDKDAKCSSDDDDGGLCSGMGNLESIIETVNLTDDNFLE